MRDESVNFLGSGYIGPVPVPVIEMFVLVLVFSLFLRSTVLGRQIYAVGSNEQAARLSGVLVNLVKLFCLHSDRRAGRTGGHHDGGIVGDLGHQCGHRQRTRR